MFGAPQNSSPGQPFSTGLKTSVTSSSVFGNPASLSGSTFSSSGSGIFGAQPSSANPTYVFSSGGTGTSAGSTSSTADTGGSTSMDQSGGVSSSSFPQSVFGSGFGTSTTGLSTSANQGTQRIFGSIESETSSASSGSSFVGSSSGIFGSANRTSPVLTSTHTFGSSGSRIFGSHSASQGSTFGAGATSSHLFGGAQTSSVQSSTSSEGHDSDSKGFATSTQGSVFGSGTSKSISAAPTFGTSVFGSKAQTSTSSVFNSQVPVSTKTTNVFGLPSVSTHANPFGTPAISNVFASTATPPTSGTFSAPKSGLFGTKASSGMASSTSVFSSGAKFSSAVFGSAQRSNADCVSSSSVFGAKSSDPTTKPADSVLKAAVQQTKSNLFGQPSSTSVFGKKSQEPSSTSVDHETKQVEVDEKSSLEAEKGSHAKAAKPRIRTGSTSKSSRRTSAEDMASRTTIICSRIPPDSFNKVALREHFLKFGAIARTTVNENAERATIQFRDHAAAEAAMKRGRYISNSHPPMLINWKKLQPGKSATSSGRVSSTTDAEMNEELAAMSGMSDLTSGSEKPLRRGPKGPPKPKREFKALPGLLKARSVSPVGRMSPAELTEKPGAAHISLKSIGGVAQTNQEKMEMLQNRDKLMHQALDSGKHADLATAKALVGTCPDMCPESERYIREARHRLSRFEVIPGTNQVDHTRAVKEYSRSSADQAMPLPIEVRPPAVLQQTMDYLMGHIMDLGQDGLWYDWYDFLWNRTRSIRKDITQQLLSDHTAVDLVQKCARFHIYCAHRLCEEEMGTFDPKINDENLTKCLQTLKEFYQDLQMQGKAPCPDEAEFRAYVVLMNLNEGDALREVQTLRAEVQSSPEVRFAVAIYSAISSSHYIRFFKLVRQAPFLMASILHRYFTQVRCHALRIMIKAYKEKYPLSDLVLHLAFEDVKEAAAFCRHYDLPVEDDCLVTSGARMILPENAFPARRAVRIIESKQNGSVGDVVNGKPLQVCPPPVPSSSFDKDGKFIGGDIPIQVPGDKSPKPDSTSAAPVSKPPAPSPMKVSAEVVKDLAKELFREVIDEQANRMSTLVVMAIKKLLDLGDFIGSDICNEVLELQIRELAEEVHKEETAAKEAERQARLQALAAHERAQSRLRAMESISAELIEETVLQETKLLTTSQMREVNEQLKAESQARVTERLSEALLAEVTMVICKDVAEEVHAVDVVARLKQLEEAASAVHVIRTARFFFAWKNQHAARVKLRRSMLTFPPAPSMAPAERQLNTLLPKAQGLCEQSMHLGGSAYLTTVPAPELRLSSLRLTWDVFIHRCLSHVRRHQAWQPLDIQGILGPQAKRRLQAHKYAETGSVLHWKLIVSTDDEDPMQDWLCAKFEKGSTLEPDLPKTKLLSAYKTALYDSSTHQLGICVRSFHSLMTNEEMAASKEHRSALGSQALLLLVNGSKSPTRAIVDARKRLKQLVDLKPLQPALPLCLLLTGSSSRSNLDQSLDLSGLVHSGAISEWEVFSIGTDCEDPTASEQLSLAVHWLVQHWPCPLNLQSQSLRRLLEDQLGLHFFTPVYQNLAKRRSQGLLDQDPQLLCVLYNSVITHLSVTLSHPDLTALSVPVPEFDKASSDWNCEDHLSVLQERVMDLTLPVFVHHADSTSDCWGNACQMVFRWMQSSLREDDPSAPELYSKIRWLLMKAEEDFQDSCLILLRMDKCQPTYVNLPWTKVITAVIEHRLLTFAGDELVYYIQQHLDQYTPPSSWLAADLDEIDNGDTHIEDSFLHSRRKRQAEAPPDDFLFVKIPRRLPINAQLPSVSLDEKNLQDLQHKLNASVQVSVQEGAEYMEYLAKVLEDSESLALPDVPLTPPVWRRDFPDVTPIVSSVQKAVENHTPLRTPRMTLKDADLDVSLVEDYHEKRLTVADGMELLNTALESEKNARSQYQMKLKYYMQEPL